jgi:hypothetical protein
MTAKNENSRPGGSTQFGLGINSGLLSAHPPARLEEMRPNPGPSPRERERSVT